MQFSSHVIIELFYHYLRGLRVSVMCHHNAAALIVISKIAVINKTKKMVFSLVHQSLKIFQNGSYIKQFKTSVLLYYTDGYK